MNYDVFISYNSIDSAKAQTIARGLEIRGLRVFVDQWYSKRGRPWQQTLELALSSCGSVLVLVGPTGLGPWQQRETQLALEMQIERPEFLVIPVLLDDASLPSGFLRLNRSISFNLDSKKAETVIDEIVSDLKESTNNVSGIKEVPARCPYRGLAAFREEDADLFFGRDVFIDRIAKLTAQRSLVAVTGASGSGKSSVVLAGLLPVLRKQQTPAWEAAVMRPGAQPFHALAATLAPISGELDSAVTVLSLAREITKAPIETLEVIISRVFEKQIRAQRLMLVIDQFEELFTTCRDNAVRDKFIDAIIMASSTLSMSIVLTIRSDFISELLENRALSDLLDGALVHVGRMTTEELAEAIRSPALRVGVQLENGLTEQLLKDVHREPGYLPLLEFTLMRLWERRDGLELTGGEYAGLGGLAGALARHAENVYLRFSPGSNRSFANSARVVFWKLTL